MDKRLPVKFFERLTEIVGQSLFYQIAKTFIERPTTFRVNSIKALKHEIIKALDDGGFKVKNVPWYSDAFILQNKSKRELMELPIYTEGKIYIQSLASMVPPLVLFEVTAGLPAEASKAKAGEKVLDLTAAPGSKTSQIAALMEKKGELVANDNNKVRFFKLKHNMELLGVVEEKGEGHGKDWKFTLRMEDGSKLCSEYKEYFDKILLDAPCSAEARFIEGDPKTYGYWSERKIKEMAYKQRKLLFSAWHALKPGGTLVYSTCTFAPEENEALISQILNRFEDAIEMAPIDVPGLKTLPPLKQWREKQFHPDVQKAIRIFPTSEIEGFFVAKLRKSAK